MRKITVFGASILILLLLNFVIYEKEQHIAEGKSVFLKLAPVDPRSLMQGDYMALRFDIARYIYNVLPKEGYERSWQRSLRAPDGLVVVNLDDKNIATYDHVYSGGKLTAKQTLLQYRIHANQVKFATNAFFFEEGTAKAYEVAKYGEFKVNDSHELLLVDMYDESLHKIEARNVKNIPKNEKGR